MPVPIVTSALIGSGSSLLGNVLGGLFSSSSAKRQNRMAIAEAQKQRDFQERLSSTAYQRAAKDLSAAGLNRILALGSPASSPGGASAPIVGALEGAATSARAVAHEIANIKNTQANTAFTNAKKDSIAPVSKIMGKAGELVEKAISWLEGPGNLAGIRDEIKSLSDQMSTSAKESASLFKQSWEGIVSQYSAVPIDKIPKIKHGKILKLDSQGLPYLDEMGQPIYIGK